MAAYKYRADGPVISVSAGNGVVLYSTEWTVGDIKTEGCAKQSGSLSIAAGSGKRRL
jgi:hypothetical protein